MIDKVQACGSSPSCLRTLPSGRLLIWAGLIVLYGGVLGFWENDAREDRHGFQDLFYELSVLCATDLELRAVGCAAFAAREGRLPATLAECAADTPSLPAFFEKEEGHSFGFAEACKEPWARGQGASPPVTLDCLGLPISYRPGDSQGFPGQFSIARQEAFGLVSNHFAAWPSPEERNFSLDSPFLAQVVAGERHLRDSISRRWVLHWGGLGLIVLAGAFLIGNPPRRRHPRWLFPLLLILGGGFAFGSANFSQKISRIWGSYHDANSAEIPLSARLTLLEQAAARDRLPEDLVRLSRNWLAGLAPAIPAEGGFGKRLLEFP